MDASSAFEVQLLGPVEVAAGGKPIAIGGERPRALLAVLALERNRVVSGSRLIDELWGDDPPARARESVQVHVSRLRRALAEAGAAERILTHGRGYLLALEKGECDVDRWEGAVAMAQDARSRGDPHQARALLDEALGIWRGEPLDRASADGFLGAERARLEQQRLSVLSDRVDLDLELGRHAEVVGDLEALVVGHPYAEALVARLMVALYRSGRQADALAAFAAARRRLVDDLGIEPGPELRRVQQDVLQQAPHLDAPHGDLPAELEPDSEVLVGREDDLAWLEDRWAQARRGSGRLVLLTGETGVGRTRLAAELAARVHLMGATVAYARGDRASDALPEDLRVQRPTLIVLDDVEAGDPSLAHRLERVAGSVGSLRALVLVIAPAPPGRALRSLDEQLARTGDSRRLGPLDGAAVEVLARAYARPNGESPPTEELLAASAGRPEDVHRAAWAWARAAAGRRAQLAAGRAGEGRRALHAAEEELAGDVIDLQRIRRRLGARDTVRRRAAAGEPCPYQGLAPFGPDDARFFFGRERLIARVIARMAGAPVVALVGPSGSGKSSVLQAGLLPALAGGVLPGSDVLRQVVLRPGEHPLWSLERAAAAGRAAGALEGSHERLLVAVDQLEELWTLCSDACEREEFLDDLVSIASRPDTFVVLAIRADFYGRCAAHAPLAALLEGSEVLVGRMRPDELRRVIELPAREVGLEVDPDLADTLVTDVAAEPGGLPLLSSALVELWERRRDGRLRLEAYDETGGVRGAVARLAEQAYGSMTGRQRAAARRILLRLGTDEPGGVVRRRVALEEFDVVRDEDAAQALAVLIDRRLLIASDDRVELAHDALLREWPRLVGWLQEDADGRRLHARLAAAARDWEESDREEGGLYRGARLAVALTWADAHGPDLNVRERGFLQASRDLADREALKVRRTNRRLRALLAGVAALLALALIGGAIALNERANARDQASLADAERLGAQALVEPQLDRSMLLAVSGQRIRDSRETRGNLLAAQLRSPAAIGELHGNGNRPLVLDLSPDNRTLAVGDNYGTVLFYDTASRRTIGPPFSAPGSMLAIRYSPDGRTLAVSGYGSRPYVELVDATTHRRRATLFSAKPGDHHDPTGVAFSPDGAVIAVSGRFDLRPDAPGFLMRWRVADRARVGREVHIPAGRGLNVAFLPAGRLIVGGDGGVEVRDATGARVLRTYPTTAHVMAVSPDHRFLAVGSLGGAVRMIGLASGTTRPFAGRHSQAVQSIGFTPDGRAVVSTGDDAAVMTWDARTLQPRETFQGHAGRVLTQDISADGSTLYTASLDGDVIIWDLGGRRRLARPFAVGPGNETQPFFDISRDGSQLAVPQQDGMVHLIDASTLAERGRLRVRGAPPTYAAYSPDGRWLAVGGADGVVRLVAVPTQRVESAMRGHAGSVWSAAFGPAGRMIATTGEDGTVRFWRVPSGASVAPPLKADAPVHDAAFSPDGRTLAMAEPDRPVEVRDMRTRRRLALLGPALGWSVRFTGDGSTLITGGDDGKVRLWSTRTWRLLAPPLAGHAGPVISLDVSPDGRLLASGSSDGTVRLWDLASARPLGAPLPGQPNRWVSARFSPDGRRLFVVHDNGRAYVWPVTVAAWRRHACAVAGRDLSAGERRDFLPRRRDMPVCPQ